MPDKEELIELLKTCFDPELQIDVWTLGLIYDLRLEAATVNVKMTLTTPFCPYGPQLLEEVEGKLMQAEGVKKVNIDLVFDPPWQPSEELRAMLGI
ncbi:metal-sulfur cluster assembly factor [Candidatus Woesearchaeota archaeon]|nr:metal-sulfur cluster assembly factor [Candidatus Woesearchaeota archaeon]